MSKELHDNLISRGYLSRYTYFDERTNQLMERFLKNNMAQYLENGDMYIGDFLLYNGNINPYNNLIEQGQTENSSKEYPKLLLELIERLYSKYLETLNCLQDPFRDDYEREASNKTLKEEVALLETNTIFVKEQFKLLVAAYIELYPNFKSLTEDFFTKKIKQQIKFINPNKISNKIQHILDLWSSCDVSAKTKIEILLTRYIENELAPSNIVPLNNYNILKAAKLLESYFPDKSLNTILEQHTTVENTEKVLNIVTQSQQHTATTATTPERIQVENTGSYLSRIAEAKAKQTEEKAAPYKRRRLSEALRELDDKEIKQKSPTKENKSDDREEKTSSSVLGAKRVFTELHRDASGNYQEPQENSLQKTARTHINRLAERRSSTIHSLMVSPQ